MRRPSHAAASMIRHAVRGRPVTHQATLVGETTAESPPTLWSRKNEKYLGSSVFPTLLAGFACLSATNVATAQSASDLVGTWQLVSVVNTAKDGAKSDVFGTTRRGMMDVGTA